MTISAQLRSTRTAFANTTSVIKLLKMPAMAAVCVSPLFLLPVLVDLDDTEARSPSAPQHTETCASWESAAVDALRHRLAGPEIGRAAFYQRANVWLIEASRNCALGNTRRATRYYRRVITTGNPEVGQQRAYGPPA